MFLLVRPIAMNNKIIVLLNNTYKVTAAIPLVGFRIHMNSNKNKTQLSFTLKQTSHTGNCVILVEQSL